MRRVEIVNSVARFTDDDNKGAHLTVSQTHDIP